MAENSKIEWTDHTFNPWIGCTKVSQGCKHCYAEHLMDTRLGRVQWGPQGVRVRTSEANWKKPLRWNRQAEAEGRRYKVFCASLADVFEDREELPPWRSDLFALIDQTPHLEWLLLTKRPENVKRLWPFGWFDDQFTWPNVRIGTSASTQEALDERLPHLLSIPGPNFLSLEPLLGPVSVLSALSKAPMTVAGDRANEWLRWVIVGGESGHNARPMDVAWVRHLIQQCNAASVPVFVKQLGARAYDELNGVAGKHMPVPDEVPLYRRLNDSKGGDMSEWPADLQVREFPQMKEAQHA